MNVEFRKIVLRVENAEVTVEARPEAGELSIFTPDGTEYTLHTQSGAGKTSLTTEELNREWEATVGAAADQIKRAWAPSPSVRYARGKQHNAAARRTLTDALWKALVFLDSGGTEM